MLPTIEGGALFGSSCTMHGAAGPTLLPAVVNAGIAAHPVQRQEPGARGCSVFCSGPPPGEQT